MENKFVIYGKTKYKATEVICETCGKSYLAAIRWLNSRKHHYCSTECACKGKSNLAKKIKLESWASTKHYCKCCGKLMVEKFGSGRFCSRACANARQHSEETKTKIASSLTYYTTDNLDSVHNKNVARYLENPNTCVICGSTLDYNKRHQKTCSDDCYKKLQSDNAINNKFGGLTDACGKTSKKGRYKNIRCDSTYELIYLAYCDLNNIKVKRNNKYFYYTNTDGKLRKYYPDFYLTDNDTYIELKGYKDSNVDLKLAAMAQQSKKVTILYKADLKVLLENINTKLNKNYKIDYANVVELYD